MFEGLRCNGLCELQEERGSEPGDICAPTPVKLLDHPVGAMRRAAT